MPPISEFKTYQISSPVHVLTLEAVISLCILNRNESQRPQFRVQIDRQILAFIVQNSYNVPLWGKNFDILKYFSYFFLENRVGHFLQIVFL